MNKPKIKKTDVNWTKKTSPQRLCQTCIHMSRYGKFNEKFRCELYVWVTFANAICDCWQGK